MKAGVPLRTDGLGLRVCRPQGYDRDLYHDHVSNLTMILNSSRFGHRFHIVTDSNSHRSKIVEQDWCIYVLRNSLIQQSPHQAFHSAPSSV